MSRPFWFLIAFLMVVSWSCTEDEKLPDPVFDPIEMVIADDEGSTGLEILKNNNLVIYNFNSFSVLTPKADFLSYTVPERHGINSMAVVEDFIFIAGKSKNGDKGKVGLSSYSANGNQLWQMEFDVPEGEEVEAISLKWLNSRLFLLYASGSEQRTAPFHKSLPLIEVSRTGEVLNRTLGQLASDKDYFTNNLFIENNNKFLVQGVRKTSQGDANDGVLVFLIENEQLKWQKEFVFSGLITINKLKENGTGGYWFIGSRQSIAWAFEMDGQGAKIAEINHQANFSEKNWFYDLETTSKGILLCGYTNSGGESLNRGLMVLVTPNRTISWENFNTPNKHNRIYAIRRRSNDDLIFAGWLQDSRTNLFESWVFSRKLDELK